MPRVSTERLARLWLAEPTASEIAVAARDLGLPSAPAGELAEAFVELFVLGVPPYASIFTEPDAELNGRVARWIEARFKGAGFAAPEGVAVAAPDHLGLWLAYLSGVGRQDAAAVEALIAWAPVCCHVVEIEPGAHPFYVGLARLTREQIGVDPLGDGDLTASERHLEIPITVEFDELPERLADPGAEVGFPEIVRFFLAPARCGVYLSRGWWGRCGKGLGLAAPFGSRFEVAAAILRQAGEIGRAELVLDRLDQVLAEWQTVYGDWAENGQWDRTSAHTWETRVGVGRAVTAAMRAQLQAHP